MLIAFLASLATMTAAMERGDVDEAARQGAQAGPTVVERALASDARATVLAGIAAAPAVADRAELLPALAKLASSGDRRVAIPAARAGRAIARELAEHGRPDDVAAADLDGWRASWVMVAMQPARFIEVRVAALDTAADLATADLGFDVAAALGDADPAFRAAAAELVPAPPPASAIAPLASAVGGDRDPHVALVAAQALCAGLVDNAPVLAALGATGMARIREVAGVADAPLAAARDAARCLAADTAAESAAVVAAIAKRSR